MFFIHMDVFKVAADHVIHAKVSTMEQKWHRYLSCGWGRGALEGSCRKLPDQRVPSCGR